MNENKRTSKMQLLKISLENATTLEEWRELALKLYDKVQKLTTDETKRVRQLRVLRKDVKRKDKALGHYKKVIRELEQRVEELEESIEERKSNIFSGLYRFVREYFHRDNSS